MKLQYKSCKNLSTNYKDNIIIMDRIADPQTYVCAVEQSVEPREFSMDPMYFSFCERTDVVLSADVEKPITNSDECFIKRRAAKTQQGVQKK